MHLDASQVSLIWPVGLNVNACTLIAAKIVSIESRKYNVMGITERANNAITRADVTIHSTRSQDG